MIGIKLFKRKYRTREQERRLLVSLIFIIGILAAVGTGVYYEKIRIYEIKDNVIKENKVDKVKVLTTIDIVGQGSEVNKSNIQEIEVDKAAVPEEYIQNMTELKNMVTRINLPKNTVITPSMLVERSKELSDDLRRQDYSHVRLPEDLEIGKYIDVRIKKSNGMDYVVISKKEIINLTESTFWTNINELERISMNVAAIEAHQNQEEIYATVYVDSENQPKAKVTYELNKEILESLEENPDLAKESMESLTEKKAKPDSEALESDTDEY